MELLSECCWSPPLGELDGILGICSECKEHTVFEELDWGLQDKYDKYDDWTRNKKVPIIKYHERS